MEFTSGKTAEIDHLEHTDASSPAGELAAVDSASCGGGWILVWNCGFAPLGSAKSGGNLGSARRLSGADVTVLVLAGRLVTTGATAGWEAAPETFPCPLMQNMLISVWHSAAAGWRIHDGGDVACPTRT